ncbi:uncharacterized protein BcabD6B2_29090 [Babesia caballi]|uniref:Uncharacterized protein n=1 Tax=Babesia caballi TaxID=5871 RepID=A0AAV4LTX8_BABCB|nr:hypothetical protein, conserved [Babesia caballi]
MPANVAKYQVCNAVLNFVVRFLEGLSAIKPSGHDKVSEVIVTLRKCVGTGKVPEGFGELVGKIETNVDAISKKVLNREQGKLKEVFKQLKVIKPTEEGSNVADQTPAVEAFLGKVENELKDDNSGYFKVYCEKLAALIKNDVFKNNAGKDTGALSYSALKNNIDDITGQVTTNLTNEFRRINTTTGNNNLIPNAAVFTAVRDAATAFIAELQTKAYTSYYNNVQNRGVNVQCAKIFLACLPLYYQALTYIYWGCHDNGGRWGNQTLANGAMKSYFDSQGLLPLYVDKSKRGAHIAGSALKGFQAEFTKGMAESFSPFPYASFATKLREKVRENGDNLSSTCPLSALFYGASYYFRCQQITTVNIAVHAPKTIREMLYFLAALQFSSAYENINGHIDTVLKEKLSVADSSDGKPDNKLSADQLKEYLRASCAFSSSVLGLIQGPSASQTDTDPWLYELFCNSAFHFKYPSGAVIFSALSNYTYALQFQLIFLYSMCGNIGLKCGWQECTYGKEINPNGSGNSLQSHICPGFRCQNATGCDHKSSGNCKHNKYTENGGCGQSGSPSPLQAFITGVLPSFGHSTSTTPNHMSDHPQGALCHVPMGFQANNLRSIGNGAVVYLVLKSICGNFSSPLRQLCEKLGCLTKRTPRTLGDMFGFTWHLKGQLAKTLSGLQNAQWLNELIRHTPISYAVENKTETLQSFVGSSRTHSSSHDTHDLKSLSNSGCNKSSQTCGPYLSPLTLSNGATFGKPAPYASTYLSWMVYLTDDLQTGFQELIDEFKNIDCKTSGVEKRPVVHRLVQRLTSLEPMALTPTPVPATQWSIAVVSSPCYTATVSLSAVRVHCSGRGTQVTILKEIVKPSQTNSNPSSPGIHSTNY